MAEPTSQRELEKTSRHNGGERLAITRALTGHHESTIKDARAGGQAQHSWEECNGETPRLMEELNSSRAQQISRDEQPLASTNDADTTNISLRKDSEHQAARPSPMSRLPGRTPGHNLQHRSWEPWDPKAFTDKHASKLTGGR